MINKNDELTGIVVGLGSNGEGIIKYDGIVVFVPFALVGEKVKFKVLKVTSKCAYGKVLEVITPAETRVRPRCIVFGKCGGCQLQHLKYSSQLKFKEETVKNCFKKIASLDVKLVSTVKCDKIFEYRNKLQLPVEQSSNGAKIGFYAENSHRVVEINDCPINPNWTSKIINSFKQYIDEFNIKGYSNTTLSGELREITAREIDGNLIIVAVVLDSKIRGIDRLIEILKSTLKCNFSLFLNVNSGTSNVIYGDKFILKYGVPFYTGELLGIKHKMGVQSFMQVNNDMCFKLYSAVRDNLGADETTTVIDAYSGAGLMTALLAKRAKKCIGVEVVSEAVDCANELAKMNGLEDKIENFNGKCEEILPSIIEREKSNGQKLCLVLDPPRKGCDYKVIDAVIKSGIEKIIYVSCMPSTLARDVGLLAGSLEYIDGEIKHSNMLNLRYKVDLVRPFDMFPQTKHVETLVVLSANN